MVICDAVVGSHYMYHDRFIIINSTIIDVYILKFIHTLCKEVLSYLLITVINKYIKLVSNSKVPFFIYLFIGLLGV